ncbi:MAG: GtrA family protein [Alphaproteobacteria bacterium]|nr:GtrA family protein [Alphaproteobacteria bacterium]
MIKLIIKLYKWAENIWFPLPEKLRYLLVGGFNTVFAYSLLNLLDWCFGKINVAAGWNFSPEVSANAALIVQYLLTINISVFTMRYYVFQSHGNWKKEFAKAWSVYVFIYLINAPILTLLMVVFGLKTWAAQAIYLIFSTIITFILHKYYSFRKK